MKFYLHLVLIGIVSCVGASSLNAATVIKLNLGETSPDVAFAAGLFGTTDDGNAATLGLQNTAIEYTDGLDARPDITTNIASFTLSGLQAVGPAQVFGTLVIQNFLNGSFNLFDPANVLLLSGTLTNSALTGVVGPPGTGSVFTTGPVNVAGGTLAPLFAQGSLSLSLTLTNINGGAGLAVGDSTLLPFSADSTVPSPRPLCRSRTPLRFSFSVEHPLWACASACAGARNLSKFKYRPHRYRSVAGVVLLEQRLKRA